MNSNDQNKFKEIMMVMGETYGSEFSQPQVKLWWTIFKPHSMGIFEQALYKHMSCPDAGMFTPKPANLMKFIIGTSKKLEQGIIDNADIAWHCVIGEVSRVGGSGRPNIDDVKSFAAIKSMGGWRSVCLMRTDQITWFKKEFVTAYMAYERIDPNDLPLCLPARSALISDKNDSNGMKSIESMRKLLPARKLSHD